MTKIRLLVAEDHTIVRQGLVNILSEYPDICIVAEAEDGNAVVDKYYEFNPDVILSDVSMPRMDGFAAARMIINKNKGAKVLFLSMYNSDEYLYKAITIGASGFITKDVIKHELIFAIRAVVAGQKYFMGKSEEEIQHVIDRYQQIDSSHNDSHGITLSSREKEILALIAKGLKSAEIANKLYVSKRTVDSCRIGIMDKLNIKSLPQLIKYAVEISYSKKE
jgi:DNA-binding NarL/FixJ family response regulator